MIYTNFGNEVEIIGAQWESSIIQGRKEEYVTVNIKRKADDKITEKISTAYLRADNGYTEIDDEIKKFITY